MNALVDESRIPELKDVVRLALTEAQRRGASECAVDASLNQGISAGVRLGEVETVEYQRDRGLGITVYFGKQKGSASTADLAAAAVRAMVEKACSVARHTAADECGQGGDACARNRPNAASEMTGPTSVDSSLGSPMVRHCMAPFSIPMTLSAISSCKYRTRSAEHR